jgi:hypothetical protein
MKVFFTLALAALLLAAMLLVNQYTSFTYFIRFPFISAFTGVFLSWKAGALLEAFVEKRKAKSV